jgi:hypothetical protein
MHIYLPRQLIGSCSGRFNQNWGLRQDFKIGPKNFFYSKFFFFKVTK